MTHAPVLVVGVDGCPGGWLAVTWHADEPNRAPVAAVFQKFTEILSLAAAGGAATISTIGVDMPIGLADHITVGGRGCDTAARKLLGARQSAIFAVPARPAVMETDYRDACAVALRHSTPPRKVSKQCFNIFPKIRELDAVLTPADQSHVIECHPEVAFVAMHAWQPVPTAKKIKSRPNPEGLAFRRALLRDNGFPIGLIPPVNWSARLAGPDDLLDACACAWTAARFVRGEARRFPETPAKDQRGLRMEIWA